jgi:hypothetical protein
MEIAATTAHSKVPLVIISWPSTAALPPKPEL